jgi:hypothetical protein
MGAAARASEPALSPSATEPKVSAHSGDGQAQFDMLGTELRAAWPHGTISLNANGGRFNNGFTVWLHRGPGCIYGHGGTPHEALSDALAKANDLWPDEATVKRRALEAARTALAAAEADIAALEAEAA